MKPPYYPIIYVRGFAATMSEIENTVATPYMGFNLGSTKLRQAHDGQPVRFIFESPLIRLMKDFGYCETYDRGDLIDAGFVERQREAGRGDNLFRSVWVFRYYEQVSGDLGTGDRVRIPEFARDLKAYIHQIRDLLCHTAAEKKKFKVHLVAHSMGGLICRCYLQTLPDNQPSYVDKVFTYATPHNGIDLGGINTPNLGIFDCFHTSNFNRKEMRRYLKIREKGDDANSLDGKFDPERFFCFIGTNYKDYDAFMGLSKRITGEMSDGLVMISNASVKKAPRAFAHRSHSGHYGIVNSEEGYQNLTRFLFGDVKVRVSIETKDITLPKAVYEKLLVKKGKLDWRRLKASYYIETSAMIRGEKYLINERLFNQASAIRMEYEELKAKPVILFTGFLKSPAITETVDGRSSFAVRVGIQVPVYEIDRKFWFDAHFEGSYILQETVVFSYDPGNRKGTLRYRTTEMEEDKPLAPTKEKDVAVYRVPLGFDEGLAEDEKPPERFCGSLVLRVSPWNQEA
jgi:pimeloyl-ACP methyl ester carboxylesterase